MRNRTLRLITTSSALLASVSAQPLTAQRAPATAASRTVADSSFAPFWQLLSDSTLERLTSEALGANHDVRAAEARVRGARAARRLTAFDFAPTVTSSSGFTQRRYSATQLPGAPASFREQDVYDAGFDASWELDLFGRVRNAFAARGALAASTREQLRDVRLSLVSELARTYFELRGAQRQLAVAERNVVNQRRTLQLTIDRLDAGRGTAFDRERASAQVSTTMAGITAIEARIAAATYRLGVLAGGAVSVPPLTVPDTERDAEVAEDGLPALPEAPELSQLPALVKNRPDVRAAERQVAAQGALVGVARAEYLPKLSVVGSVGFNAGATSLLGRRESSRYAIGPVVSWPAFDLGRVRTQVDAARAEADEARARHAQTMLGAEAEAASAVASYDRARSRVVFLRQAAAASERGAELARLRFDNGAADFLEVLDAQRTLLEAQDQLARGETDAATAYLALYKALGGAWSGGAGELRR